MTEEQFHHRQVGSSHQDCLTPTSYRGFLARLFPRSAKYRVGKMGMLNIKHTCPCRIALNARALLPIPQPAAERESPFASQAHL